MMSKVSIDRSRGFTQISNDIFRDKRVSIKAVGLYCLLWSLPEDWNVSASGIAEITKDEKESVASAIAELETLGYLRKEQKRSGGGRFRNNDVVLYGTPSTEKPLTEIPSAEKSSAAQPSTEKPAQENTIKENTIKQKENTSTNVDVQKKAAGSIDNDGGGKSAFSPPSEEEVEAYCAEKGLIVDPYRFFDYYASRSWRGVTNWRRRLMSWNYKDVEDAKARKTSGNATDWDENEPDEFTGLI